MNVVMIECWKRVKFSFLLIVFKHCQIRDSRYHGICHQSFAFPRFTPDSLSERIFQDNTSDKLNITWYTTRGRCITISHRAIENTVRELKQSRFWGADRNWKWVIFTFNLPSHNYIRIAKHLFAIRDEWYKTPGDNTILAREMFSSGCR